jgi:hypothetical protein
MIPARLIRPEPSHLTVNRTFQGIPGIAMTPKGRLWATWYTGGNDEGPDNFVVLVRSDDRGKTWTDTVVVVEHASVHVRTYDPALWVDPQNRLWCFWSQSFSKANRNIFDGVAGVWGATCHDPEADELVWSQPVRIANGVMMNKPTVLRNGDWVLPTALWRQGLGGGEVPAELMPQCGANVTLSRDQGRTFEFVGGVAVPDRWFDEHMLVELKDGRLWVLVRTDRGIGQSFSSDGGRTWTPGEDTGFGGPNARFFIRRLNSGNLLLVNHQVDPEQRHKRQKLTAYVSIDDGRSWGGGLMLDEREQVSYPDGFQEADGALWIIYDRARRESGDILFARFREEDAAAGRPVTADVALKQLINRTGLAPA